MRAFSFRIGRSPSDLPEHHNDIRHSPVRWTYHSPDQWSKNPNRSLTNQAERTATKTAVWSSVGQSGDVFFRLDLCFYVQTPEIDQLRQDLIDAERVKLLQPLVRWCRNGCIGVFCHDIGDVLKYLKAFNVQCRGILCIFSHRLLQCCKVLINISAKFQTIQSYFSSFK